MGTNFGCYGGFWLVVWLAAGCGAPRIADPPREVTVQPATEETCLGGATRVSKEPCSIRLNRGVWEQRCIAEQWLDHKCLCTGRVKFSDPSLQKEVLTALQLDTVMADQAATLKKLEVDRAHIKNLEGLECFFGLEELDASYNEVIHVGPLAKLEKLETLNLSQNNVRDLRPLANLEALTYVYLSSNDIWDIAPLERLANAEDLRIANNHITDLTPLREHHRVKILSLVHNCISDLTPLANLRGLEALAVGYNRVVDVSPLAGHRALKDLGLTGNRVVDLKPLTTLRKLQSLYLDSNALRDVSALTELRWFSSVNVQRNRLDCSAQAKSIELLKQIAEQNGGKFYHDCDNERRRGPRKEPVPPPKPMYDHCAWIAL